MLKSNRFFESISMAGNEVTKSRRGGRRVGAGRPPNALTKQKALSLRERYPVFPLDHMMMVLNTPDPVVTIPEIPADKLNDADFQRELNKQVQMQRQQAAQFIARKDEMAKAAAPYTGSITA